MVFVETNYTTRYTQDEALGIECGSMICPHCTITIHESWSIWSSHQIKDAELYWTMQSMICPECKKNLVRLISWPHNNSAEVTSRLVQPKAIARKPIPPEVPENIASDYREACLVLADSPKASAALSRRCLQNILREKAELRIFNSETHKIENQRIKKGDLSQEIQQLLDNGGLPNPISQAIDAVRNIGNFAAHPNKSKSTGEVVDVEPGEAEWNLDVIESLFDYYFVQPAQLQAKRDALNEKLKDAGKPPVK